MRGLQRTKVESKRTSLVTVYRTRKDESARKPCYPTCNCSPRVSCISKLQLFCEFYADVRIFGDVINVPQADRVLYLLTLVTTVFIPAQFLTGLWGMNFDDMPELHFKYGYTMFWLLVVGLTIISSTAMKLSGMFDKL